MKNLLLASAVVPVFCLISLTDASDTKAVKLQENFEIQLGQTASVAGEGLTMTPLAVVEDSRCPENVECFQAGEIDVSLKISLKGASDNETINNLYIKPLFYKDFVIRLLDAKPARHVPKSSDKGIASQPIRPSEYVFIFRISKIADAGAKRAHVEKPTFDGVIFPGGKPLTLHNIYHDRWVPAEEDIVKAEKFLPGCIQGEFNRRKELVAQGNGYFDAQEEENMEYILKNLADYKRQYFGIINEYSGEQTIYINAFHKDTLGSSDSPKWQEEYVAVNGGGKMFFQIEFHPSRGSCSNFYINEVK